MARHDEPTVTLTLAELDARIQSAVNAAAAGAVQGLTALQQQMAPPDPNEWRKRAIPIEVRMVPCKSRETGATFIAEIQHDRVVDLKQYTMPPEARVSISEGGTLPDAFIAPDANGQPTASCKHHWYRTYWRVDLDRYVGKRLDPTIVVPDAAE